jgi:predicted DNA-binding transcriptional regulator AlpA
MIDETKIDETKPRKRHIIPDPNRPQLRSIDLMRRWGCSRQSLYNWRKAGLLPDPIAIGPNVWVYPLEVIQELERKRASA